MGPLKGIRIVEFAGLGPGPFAAMLFADMGADVLRIDRKGAGNITGTDILNRGRQTVALDLKNANAVEAVLKLVERADGLIEGFRPGVMERLGLGPDHCLNRNRCLVYGRMTGWGQTGPLAQSAGHDINYIALSGALHAIGERGGRPIPPLSLVGDFAGGALFLAFGMISAMLEARTSGIGQIVDAAMLEGAISVMSVFYSLAAAGFWTDERGSNLLDGGAHFYGTYETADNKWIALGPLEPSFYREMLVLLDIDDPAFAAQMDRSQWPRLQNKVAAVVKGKTRDEWDAVFAGSDACYAPVLSMTEAPDHPQNLARGNFIELNGIVQPAPTPRFSRTPASVPVPPTTAETALASWGFTTAEIAALRASDAL
ncbi:MAG: CoA transferase [Alphaproteobacteria bacterium]|nr:CoA transferase [Alphaproteobacteria bacterium]